MAMAFPIGTQQSAGDSGIQQKEESNGDTLNRTHAKELIDIPERQGKNMEEFKQK
jgi:hypothetical protein